VHATDVAQNVQSPDAQSVFIVDAVAPTAAITNPANAAYYNASNVLGSLATAAGANLLKGTVTDDLSGVASVSTKLTRYTAAAGTEYWTGSAWQGTDPGYVLTPTLAASGPGVLSTTWQITNP